MLSLQRKVAASIPTTEASTSRVPPRSPVASPAPMFSARSAPSRGRGVRTLRQLHTAVHMPVDRLHLLWQQSKACKLFLFSLSKYYFTSLQNAVQRTGSSWFVCSWIRSTTQNSSGGKTRPRRPSDSSSLSSSPKCGDSERTNPIYPTTTLLVDWGRHPGGRWISSRKHKAYSAIVHVCGIRPNVELTLTFVFFRYQYTTGALKPVPERQLVYKCGPKALKFLKELQREGYWGTFRSSVAES